MVFITAVGVFSGLMAIVLRPFSACSDHGRFLAKGAILIGVASPVLFFLLIGPELSRHDRLFLMSPIVLGLSGLAIYPKKTPEARGFDVVSWKDQAK